MFFCCTIPSAKRVYAAVSWLVSHGMILIARGTSKTFRFHRQSLRLAVLVLCWLIRRRSSPMLVNKAAFPHRTFNPHNTTIAFSSGSPTNDVESCRQSAGLVRLPFLIIFRASVWSSVQSSATVTLFLFNCLLFHYPEFPIGRT